MIQIRPKLQLFLIFLFFFKTTSKAQESYLDVLINATQTNFYFGKDNSNIKDYKKGLWGFQGGVSYQKGITPYFSLVPELYYFNKGVQLKDQNLFTFSETKIRLNTIEMPILSRFHYKKMYLNVGPSFAYNLSGKIKIDGNDIIEKETIKIPFKNVENGFKRWDFGVQFGLGYEFKLKNQSRIAIDTRYHYGITNISHQKEMYNRYFYMTILWAKPLKSKH